VTRDFYIYKIAEIQLFVKMLNLNKIKNEKKYSIILL